MRLWGSLRNIKLLWESLAPGFLIFSISAINTLNQQRTNMPQSVFHESEARAINRFFSFLYARLEDEVRKGKYPNLTSAIDTAIAGIDQHDLEEDAIPVVTPLLMMTLDFYLWLKKEKIDTEKDPGHRVNKMQKLLGEVKDGVVDFKINDPA